MPDPEVAVETGGEGPQNIADVMDEAFAEPVEEAPSPDTPEPESEDSPPSEPDDSSPPRNDKGQFVKKGEESSEDPPVEETAPPEDEPTESETDDVVADEPATEEAKVEAEPAPDLPEFTFRVSGRDFSIAGSKVGDDGIFIPKSEVERTQRLISLGQGAKQRDREIGREVAAARAEGGIQSKINNEIFDRLVEARSDPDGKLWNLFNNQQDWDLMVANSKIAAMEAGETERGEVSTQAANEQAAADLGPKLEAGVSDAIDEALKDSRYEGVDGVEVKARLKQQYNQVFHTVAPGDTVPDGMTVIGHYEQGDVVIDNEFVRGELEFYAGVARRATEKERAVEKVAVKNRQTLAPKAVSGKKAPPTPEPKPIPKELTEQEKVEHIFGEGWNDL